MEDMSFDTSLPPSLAGGDRLERSWADVGAPTILTIWRHIRSLRYQPPGRADVGERKRIFGAALEQAEQLFTAAEAVGYASRPILLFYGLSQAGRAIAAASTLADNDHYKLVRHGIKTRDLDHGEFYGITVIDSGSGSFTQLAPLLRSGTLPQGTSLGQLWNTIPDLRDPPLPTERYEHLPILSYKNAAVTTGYVVGTVSGLPNRLESASSAGITEFLRAYPSLAGSSASSLAAQAITRDPITQAVTVHRQWLRPASKNDLAPFTWREEDMSDWQIMEDRLTQPYRGDSERYVFPAIGGASQPLHPLLTWWALLFALSMLARYEPASWTNHLQRDESANAVPIEAALDRALHTCPELVAHAVSAVSN
jgi:hypothetical protein